MPSELIHASTAARKKTRATVSSAVEAVRCPSTAGASPRQLLHWFAETSMVPLAIIYARYSTTCSFPFSKECQLADWQRHKVECKEYRARKAQLQVGAVVMVVATAILRSEICDLHGEVHTPPLPALPHTPQAQGNADLQERFEDWFKHRETFFGILAHKLLETKTGTHVLRVQVDHQPSRTPPFQVGVGCSWHIGGRAGYGTTGNQLEWGVPDWPTVSGTSLTGSAVYPRPWDPVILSFHP
jgi:hypothetical protein